MAEAFAWASPWGVSVALFLAASLFQVLIGLLTAAWVAGGRGGNALFFTERADGAAFGRAPRDMVAAEPGLDAYRRAVWLSWAGLLGAVGLLEGAVAWFGLRAGAPWALAVLAGVAVLLAACWAAILAMYLGRGARVSLADVPPFMWVPTVLRAGGLAAGLWGLA